MIEQLTSRFLKHLYSDAAWGYDFIASIVSMGKWNDWVEVIVPMISGPNVLELGYGPGHLQANLMGSNFSLYGIDQSFQMGKIAIRRMDEPQANNKCMVGKAQQLPFTDNHFNTIFATFPTEYIYHHESLLEIRRALRPDGTLLLLLAVWVSESSLIGAALAILYRLTGQTPQKKGYEKGITWPLEKAGFSVEVDNILFNGDKLLIVKAKQAI